MKFGFRQTLASVSVFAVIMTFLVSLDDRVRARFGDLLSAGADVTPLGHRFSELVNALVEAATHQSIENAPMLIFAVVGGVLFLFMLKA
jgi:hypothetical protein